MAVMMPLPSRAFPGPLSPGWAGCAGLVAIALVGGSRAAWRGGGSDANRCDAIPSPARGDFLLFASHMLGGATDSNCVSRCSGGVYGGVACGVVGGEAPRGGRASLGQEGLSDEGSALVCNRNDFRGARQGLFCCGRKWLGGVRFTSRAGLQIVVGRCGRQAGWIARFGRDCVGVRR